MVSSVRLQADDRDHLPAPDRQVAVLAAAFHDVVYDPQNQSNEDESASLLLKTIPGPSSMAAAYIIRATKTHDPVGLGHEGLIVLDADLSILGAPVETYRSYSEAVREEYSFVSDEDWIRGRAAVLESFLARSQIYATETGRRRWDRMARHNLRWELGQLRTRN